MNSPAIEESLARCLAAFAQYPNAKYAWCCHHAVLVEALLEPPEARIDYILQYKAFSEQATRLDNFRPVTDEAQVAPFLKVCHRLVDAWLERRDSLDADYAAKMSRGLPENTSYEAYIDELMTANQTATTNAINELHEKTAKLQAEWTPKLMPLYKANVPLGTWNGKSIFQHDPTVKPL